MMEKLKRREKGQGMVEYALIVGLVSVFSLVSLRSIGVNVGGVTNQVSKSMVEVVGADGDIEEIQEFIKVEDFKVNHEAATRVGLKYTGDVIDGGTVKIPSYVYGMGRDYYMTNDGQKLRGNTVILDGEEIVYDAELKQHNEFVVVSLKDLFKNETGKVILKGDISVELSKDNQVRDFSGMLAGQAFFLPGGKVDGVRSIDLTKFNVNGDRIVDRDRESTMSGMFKGCSGLEEIRLGKGFDTRGVTDMSEMFGGTRELTNLELGDSFTTRDVKNMSKMFSSSGIENLDLSNFDTSSAEDMSNMFEMAMGVKSVRIGENFRPLGDTVEYIVGEYVDYVSDVILSELEKFYK